MGMYDSIWIPIRWWKDGRNYSKCKTCRARTDQLEVQIKAFDCTLESFQLGDRLPAHYRAIDFVFVEDTHVDCDDCYYKALKIARNDAWLYWFRFKTRDGVLVRIEQLGSCPPCRGHGQIVSKGKPCRSCKQRGYTGKIVWSAGASHVNKMRVNRLGSPSRKIKGWS